MASTTQEAQPFLNWQSKAAQAKSLLKTYGSAYLVTSISFAAVSFAAQGLDRRQARLARTDDEDFLRHLRPGYHGGTAPRNVR